MLKFMDSKPALPVINAPKVAAAKPVKPARKAKKLDGGARFVTAPVAAADNDISDQLQPSLESSSGGQEPDEKAVEAARSDSRSSPEGGSVNVGILPARESTTKRQPEPTEQSAAEVPSVRVAPAPARTVIKVPEGAPAPRRTAAQERLFSRAPLTTGAKLTARPTLRPCPLAAKREQLARAIAYLKREHAILITVWDRDAPVRTYRVSGRKFAIYADDVIDLAVEKGMAA